jgi:large subunit ribosomal protein L21
MYAIVDVAGQQFKVEKNQKIYVHRLEGKEGDVVEFDRVLLIEDGDKILIGEPIIQGARVSGKIISHLKGDKVKIFKKKKRKGYQVLKGHRQYMSQILIENIVDKGAKKKEVDKKAEGKPDTKVSADTPVKEKTSAVKKAAVKKSAEKPKAKPKAALKKQPSPAKKTTAKAAPKKGGSTKKKTE